MIARRCRTSVIPELKEFAQICRHIADQEYLHRPEVTAVEGPYLALYTVDDGIKCRIAVDVFFNNGAKEGRTYLEFDLDGGRNEHTVYI